MLDLSHASLCSILKEHESEFSQLEAVWHEHKGRKETGYFEGKLSYSLVRAFKPSVIFEVGPEDGWSTLPLALAVKNNGFGLLYVFEKVPIHAETTISNLVQAKLLQFTKVIPGDFRETSSIILKETGKIDVLFMDNGHDDYIAEWYIANLFPHVKQLIFVHDMTYGTPDPHDEKHVVFDFLKKNPEFQNFLVKDYYPHAPIQKQDGPGGSANSGIWIRIPRGKISG